MKKTFAVGIDFGATQIKIGMVNPEGKVLSRKVIATPRDISPLEFGKTAKREISHIISDSGKSGKCVGVGIGVPGLVQFDKGVVLYLVNVKGWKKVPLAALLSREVGLPVWVDNDVNAMTLGEFTYGAGRGGKNIVCLTLGTGVGGGIILNGEIYRGTSYAAGEIGHIVIQEQGRECACGGKGCLEAYIGNRQIMVLGKGRYGSPKEISDAARKGDLVAAAIWKEVGTHLGVALSSVINLLNPEKIVIGGGVANAGTFLFNEVHETVRKRAMKGPADSVKIVKAQLGEDAGIIGAAVLAGIK
ncbi:MAG: ROK family protein [Candidatus Omnitrophica bacterium]|nr:ROK family protein [Candidatus Omnitrophota bacterium]